MSDEVRTRTGHRVIPPAELPPGAIGWAVYEQEDPGELGRPSDSPWERIGFIPAPVACSPDHHTQCGSIEIGDNQDRDCLSLYQDEFADDAETDTIHICDWPALKAAIDQHQRERGGRI